MKLSKDQRDELSDCIKTDKGMNNERLTFKADDSKKG